MRSVQTITWNNTEQLSVGPPGTRLIDDWFQVKEEYTKSFSMERIFLDLDPKI